MKKIFIRIGFLSLLFCSGCATVATNTITQTSTIDALLAGSYDGSVSCRQLLQYGDFGIGTFDRLDGEMILLNGRIYQVKADGAVYMPDPSVTSPFASVCRFVPDNHFTLQSKSDYKMIQETIDQAVPNKNIFCAVRIHGRFASMKTRSVPAQTKPYPLLADVTKNQPVFNMESIQGTIVGFRCPDFVKGVNVPGYHFHFLSDDSTRGGHILDFVLDEGNCEVDVCHRFLLVLPEGGKGMEHLDLSLDRTGELQKVEK
ncbi:MAG: acetolactate decarboxylase [Candidatus Aureabacteria bacterium]|nr:acetolactate decarboxylase [Candidatus Auribacterota bacterium]